MSEVAAKNTPDCCLDCEHGDFYLVSCEPQCQCKLTLEHIDAGPGDDWQPPGSCPFHLTHSEMIAKWANSTKLLSAALRKEVHARYVIKPKEDDDGQ